MSEELNNKRIEEILSNAKEVKVIRPKENFGAVWMPQKNKKIEQIKEEVTEPTQKRPPFFWI